MTGVLTLSVEVELAWGNHDTGEFERLSEDGEAERHYLSRLLAATERHQVPFSFDVVGHLLLESCSGTHDGPHPDGWFRADPGTERDEDGLYYAPDAVEEIRSTSTGHEICTHTFSHALFDEMSRETTAWELRRVQELHRETLGRPATSIVPPRHHSPPYDLLKEYGIEVIRPAMRSETPTKFHRYKELLVGSLPLSELRMRDGVVETSCTTYPSLTAPAFPPGQGPAHRGFRYLPDAAIERLHVNKLAEATRRAVENDGHLHLWCHLFDVSNRRQLAAVGAYLEWLETYREEADLTVATMDELPDHV